MSISSWFAASVVAVSFSVDVAEANDMVPVPEGSGLTSIALPDGNGGEFCGPDALFRAFIVVSDIQSGVGLNAYSIPESIVNDEPTLAVMEASRDYHDTNLNKVVQVLKGAFGLSVVRLITPNDTQHSQLLKDIGPNNGIIVPAEFWVGDKNDSKLCADIELPSLS